MLMKGVIDPKRGFARFLCIGDGLSTCSVTGSTIIPRSNRPDSSRRRRTHDHRQRSKSNVSHDGLFEFFQATVEAIKSYRQHTSAPADPPNEVTDIYTSVDTDLVRGQIPARCTNRDGIGLAHSIGDATG